MAGLSDFLAQAQLNHATGAIPLVSANQSRFVALFSTAPTADAGTGGTEISGNGYARIQVAGALAVAAAGGPFAGTTITLAATAPAWLLALGVNGSGVNVYDSTGTAQCGTVSSISGTTVTLTGTTSHSVANSDTLFFSAFPLATASSGTEPAVTSATVTNGASITWAQSTGAWSNVVAWGVYDASSSGNLYYWDYTGGGKWSPFTCTSASPGVLTVTDQSFVNGNSVVVSTKAVGTLPTTGGSWAGVLTVAGVSGSTFNVSVNTTSTGDGLVRPVISYAVGISTTFSFAASSMTLSAA